jgi:N-methylhydantoinase A
VPYRITVDVGGTFSDVVVADERGRLTLGKALTTRERIFDGLYAALESAAEELGLGVAALLTSCELFVYGTTHATNAILEGTTARTGFLVTEGFPDVLVRREGGKLNPFDFDEPYPAPYVPKRLTREIPERVGADGGIVLALDAEAAASAIRSLGSLRVEAIAVCLLWSVVNPAHELALAEIIERELPGVPYTLSHELNPILREYRRASTTAIDASLKPLMQRHLRDLERDLRAAGLPGELLAAVSVGGVMHFDSLIERPVFSVKSGPALAPVAGLVYGQAEDDAPDLIVCDTGGTSFDVSLVRGGRIISTRETWLGPRYTGHLVALSSVDVRSIGAGGGSIAWIDDGGLLRVGPRSAGASPGPAAYGLGGTEPTVTDAATVLGYLDPAYFLRGRIPLDVVAARAVLDGLARALGVTHEAASYAVLALANEHMVTAIREITVNQGVDPRESFIVAGGGAAGLTIVPIARELGCRRVLVPRTAGALSACGAQYSDVVAEFAASRQTTTNDFAVADVNATLDRIDASIERFSTGLRGRGLAEVEIEYAVEARYPFQVWDIDVPLRVRRFAGGDDVSMLEEDFHLAHERVFAVREPGQHVECVNWKGRMTAGLPRPPLETRPPRDHAARPDRLRTMYFDGVGEVRGPVLLGGSLEPGAAMAGPAVIQEPTTTIVLYPGSTCTVTALGNYLIDVG